MYRSDIFFHIVEVQGRIANTTGDYTATLESIYTFVEKSDRHVLHLFSISSDQERLHQFSTVWHELCRLLYFIFAALPTGTYLSSLIFLSKINKTKLGINISFLLQRL